MMLPVLASRDAGKASRKELARQRIFVVRHTEGLAQQHGQ